MGTAKGSTSEWKHYKVTTRDIAACIIAEPSLRRIFGHRG